MKTLVVEDEKKISAFIGTGLEAKGFSVTLADNDIFAGKTLAKTTAAARLKELLTLLTSLI